MADLLQRFDRARERPGAERADLAALQHGAKLFVNYCLNCHSASYMRYNRMRDIGLRAAFAELHAGKFGDIKADLGLRTVHKAGVSVHLTPIEYRLLGVLVANAGRVLTHRHLLREVWGPSHVEHNHYLRVFMGSLRHKLEDDPAQPKMLVTETGVGYRLIAN